MSCGYEGTHFGASYPDACCIDGHLWDLDSDDGGMLTSGGEIPCPACNLDAFVASFMADAEHEALNADAPTEPAALLARWLFMGRVFELHGIGGFAAAARRQQLQPLWFGGTGYDPDLDNAPVGRIAWPWPLDESLPVSAHLLLEAASLAGDPGPRFARTPEGWRIAPLEEGDW